MANMHWRTIALLLCAYGVLKEFKPIEPYLYPYQHTYLNISREVLNSEVYPYWTYSYLLLLIPVMLLTDLALYKPVLLLESLAYVSVWLTLIFGRSVLSQKVGQILYGLATATEVAYLAYAYVKIGEEHYFKVTAWTRAALQFGKCFGYLLAQLIVLLHWGDYQTLNWLSLASLSLTFFFALALPWVSWRQLVQNESQKEETTNLPLESLQAQQTTTMETKAALPEALYCQSYGKFAVQKMRGFFIGAQSAFSDGQVRRWSLWWALATCGYLQVGNYIQPLWDSTEQGKQNRQIYNGFVEAVIPLLSACTIMCVHRLQVNWARWGELALTCTALLECLLLLAMSRSGNLWSMYAGYATVRILYHISITVAQFNIATRIDISGSAFVFGLNTFLALALQTLLTFMVVDSQGPFKLGVRTQFLIYGAYHGLIAAIFLGAQLISCFHK